MDKNRKKGWEEGYDKENYPLCNTEEFWCRVYINDDGVAYREVVTLDDKVILDNKLLP